jgi:hypothetical protein
MTISPDGRYVYVSYPSSGSDPAGVGIFSRDTSTGALTWSKKVTTASFILSTNSMVMSADGKSLYVSYPGSSGAAGVGVYSRTRSFSYPNLTAYATFLPPGTKIYFRGYATNSIGTKYSEDGSFNTL